jgi:citrate synthase
MSPEIDEEPVAVYHPGLEGVIANETAICNMDGLHGLGGLAFRGYDIEDLAGHVSYEEVAYLLLHGDLPNRAQLHAFDTRLRSSRTIPSPLVQLYRHMPVEHNPMDVLRTSVSVLSHYDPEVDAPPTDHAANIRKAERLIAQMPTCVAYFERIAHGHEPVRPNHEMDHAANFLSMIRGKPPSETMRKAFDLSLVLYAEHELNASTFCGRVTVSTLSDLYSGIVSAIGTLKGPLHGGANEEAWKVLERVGTTDNAEPWITQALANKERIMGFGHRVYKTGDPRARILKPHCQALAVEYGQQKWEQISEVIENAVTEHKHLPPNVDWPSARLYHYMGLDINIYTPIFAMARVAGWSAHIIEQLEHNRLMRPRGRYVGPAHRVVKSIEERN